VLTNGPKIHRTSKIAVSRSTAGQIRGKAQRFFLKSRGVSVKRIPGELSLSQMSLYESEDLLRLMKSWFF
jgi:hypothetical protein